MNNFIYEYYQKIYDGSEVVGVWIRLLYELIVTGIESGIYIFDQKEADRAITYFEKFVRHNKGILAPQRIKLSLWEKAALSLIYGIKDPETNYRQFREIAIFVGRKCGKTIIGAGMASYEAYVDGEYGSEIYFLAPKLDQADLAYTAWEHTTEKNADLLRRTKKRKTDYYIQESNTTVKKIAFNEKKSDGYNPMFVLADEMSSWPAARGLKQYEAMLSGTGSRIQPLIVSISSGGYIDEGEYDELIKRGTRFLKGDSKEKSLLPIFYMIDDPKKWDDINELRKSLPGLGTSVTMKFILDWIELARSSPSKKSEFLTKFCNLKQNSSLAWLETGTVEKCFGEPLKLKDFKSNYCVAGIDLSQTTDLTAVTIIIEKNEELYVFAKFFLPAEKIKDAIARDGIPYETYIEKGFLQLSGDNFIDYRDVYTWITGLVEELEILPLQVGYDRYSAQYIIQDLKSYGFKCDDVYQGDNLYPVLQEMEGLFKDGKVHCGDNDLLKVHMLNAAIKMSTERGRGRLVKLKPNMHIDGVAALADAFTVRQKWYDEIGEQLKNRE